MSQCRKTVFKAIIPVGSGGRMTRYSIAGVDDEKPRLSAVKDAPEELGAKRTASVSVDDDDHLRATERCPYKHL